MKVVLGLIVIIGTLVIASRQPANKLGSVLGVLLTGLMIFSLVAQLPESKRESGYSGYIDSNNYAYGSNTTNSGTRDNRRRALTKEEADALSGTGYKGTRPNSLAEAMELQAAQVNCKECGYHTDNGRNSSCDYCQNRK